MDRLSETERTNEELLEFLLDRPPSVPLPPENASVETWKSYVRELKRQDPEAFEMLDTLFHSGIRIPGMDQKKTGTRE